MKLTFEYSLPHDAPVLRYGDQQIVFPSRTHVKEFLKAALDVGRQYQEWRRNP